MEITLQKFFLSGGSYRPSVGHLLSKPFDKSMQTVFFPMGRQVSRPNEYQNNG